MWKVLTWILQKTQPEAEALCYQCVKGVGFQGAGVRDQGREAQ